MQQRKYNYALNMYTVAAAAELFICLEQIE